MCIRDRSTPKQPIRCQNCQLPLQIDGSLLDLSLTQQNTLLDSLANETSINDTHLISPIPKDRLQNLQNVKPASQLDLKPNNQESYIFLKQSKLPTESQDQEDLQPSSQGVSKTLSTQTSVLSNIFNILSGRNKIDYPVCQDCCNLLIQDLKNQYDSAIKERDTYMGFLKKLEAQKEQQQQNEGVLTDKDDSDSLIAVEDLQREKSSLFQDLLKLEKEDEELDEQIKDLELKLEQKKNNEMEMIERDNLTHLDHINFLKETQSLKNQYNRALNDLDQLRKINIYDETFKIAHNGPFATINGLRIGGFDDLKVSWKEINAGIGHVVLLSLIHI